MLADITRERPQHQGARAAVEAGISLRARSHERQAGVADRGAAGAEGRCAGRVVLADAARAARRAREAVRLRPAGRERGHSHRLHAGAARRSAQDHRGLRLRADVLSRSSFRARAPARARRARFTCPAPTAARTGRAPPSIPKPTSSTCRRRTRRSSRSSCRRRRVRTRTRCGRATSGRKGPQGLPLFKPPYGRLVAIDLNKGEIKWTVANGDGPRDHPAIKDLNLPPLGNPGRVGPLVTKTPRVHGRGHRHHDQPPGAGGKKFRAFDKATGTVVWETDLDGGTSGVPMTYIWQGKQYIVVPIGWTGPSGRVRRARAELKAFTRGKRNSMHASMSKLLLKLLPTLSLLPQPFYGALRMRNMNRNLLLLQAPITLLPTVGHPLVPAARFRTLLSKHLSISSIGETGSRGSAGRIPLRTSTCSPGC